MTLKNITKYSIAFVLLFAAGLAVLFAEEGQEEFPFLEENNQCLRCHGKNTYEFYNEYSGKTVKRHMGEQFRIDSAKYYESNHRTFSCYDCHSYDDDHYPHPEEVRMEEAWNCIDCHGYDDNYAQYHFEEIDEEFMQSVHYNANEDNFTCWKCHDPHTYKISARTNENILHTIAYDNDICLSCHADFDRFQLLTNRDGIDIIKHHDWLPNQGLHFRSVRCIECHTKINDTILIAHLVLPKDSAVRRCAECHSRDSRLMSTLYKFQSKEDRADLGFLNAVIINRSFVIGANRNHILNKVSIVIALGTLLIIAIHALLRILTNKK